jgi:hypothetical protein
MPWPNSARATGYIVTAANWNEIAAAFALWGGNADADGNSLIDVGTMVCGNGDATGTTTGGTIRGAARTGTNVAGSDVTVAGGNGTGTGGGGALIFQTAPTGASGSTVNTLAERMRVTPDGRFSIASAAPTAGIYGASPVLNVAGTDGDSAAGQFQQFSSNNSPSSIYFTKSRSASLNNHTAVQNGDVVAYIAGAGSDGTTYDNEVAIIRFQVDGTVSTNSVPGRIVLATANTSDQYAVDRMVINANGGVTVGSPTGGSQGAGTINAQAVYDDGVLLTCYVPELKLKGGDPAQIDVAAWDARVPDRVIPARLDARTGEVIEPERVEIRLHEPLRDFLANRADTIDPRVYAQRWKSTGVLPGFPSPQEWQANGPLSTGQVIQKLWEHLELQAVHISALCDEIDSLRG